MEQSDVKKNHVSKRFIKSEKHQQASLPLSQSEHDRVLRQASRVSERERDEQLKLLFVEGRPIDPRSPQDQKALAEKGVTLVHEKNQWDTTIRAPDYFTLPDEKMPEPIAKALREGLVLPLPPGFFNSIAIDSRLSADMSVVTDTLINIPVFASDILAMCMPEEIDPITNTMVKEPLPYIIDSFRVFRSYYHVMQRLRYAPTTVTRPKLAKLWTEARMTQKCYSHLDLAQLLEHVTAWKDEQGLPCDPPSASFVQSVANATMWTKKRKEACARVTRLVDMIADMAPPSDSSPDFYFQFIEGERCRIPTYEDAHEDLVRISLRVSAKLRDRIRLLLHALRTEQCVSQMEFDLGICAANFDATLELILAQEATIVRILETASATPVPFSKHFSETFAPFSSTASPETDQINPMIARSIIEQREKTFEYRETAFLNKQRQLERVDLKTLSPSAIKHAALFPDSVFIEQLCRWVEYNAPDKEHFDAMDELEKMMREVVIKEHKDLLNKEAGELKTVTSDNAMDVEEVRFEGISELLRLFGNEALARTGMFVCVPQTLSLLSYGKEWRVEGLFNKKLLKKQESMAFFTVRQALNKFLDKYPEADYDKNSLDSTTRQLREWSRLLRRIQVSWIDAEDSHKEVRIRTIQSPESKKFSKCPICGLKSEPLFYFVPEERILWTPNFVHTVESHDVIPSVEFFEWICNFKQ